MELDIDQEKFFPSSSSCQTVKEKTEKRIEIQVEPPSLSIHFFTFHIQQKNKPNDEHPPLNRAA